jgi:RNA polymerase sigma-70 factor (ECF subfamily)
LRVGDGTPSADREAFDQLLTELRPRLHRYCARMTGSVFDGDDSVQEACVKALEALKSNSAIDNVEAWLFRIAHNAALDFLRRRTRLNAANMDEDVDMIADGAITPEERAIASASLRSFMGLTVMERSSVILMDVLDYSLLEIGSVTGASIPATKAALHRGRARLRECMHVADTHPTPTLTDTERRLLQRYVEYFNAHDFDAIRDMLADEVRLDLVSRKRMTGRKEVGKYFTNYGEKSNWHLSIALVDRRPAIVVRDPGDPSGAATYFILLQWMGDRLAGICDYRYVRYVTEGAEIIELQFRNMGR